MNLTTLIDGWRSPQSVGIDFGASHFKIVQLLRQREGVRLQACGMAEVGLNEDEDAAIRRIRVFLREHPMKFTRAVVSVTDDSLRIRRMELARMPDRDLKVAIRWNFREQVDVPLEKYIVSYTTIPGQAAEERVPLMAYGIAEDAVNRRQARCRKLGFRAAAVEPGATALLAAFDHNVGWVEGQRVALLDLGFHETLFLVMSEGVLLFSRPLAGVSGERLVRILGREGSVPVEQVQSALKTMLGGGPVPEGLSAGMEEFYTQMLVEIQRSIDGFVSLYRTEEGIQHLYLCGGGSFLPNLTGHITKNVGVPTDIFNPFAKIADAQGTMPAAVEQAPLYAVAVGLALPQRAKGKGE